MAPFTPSFRRSSSPARVCAGWASAGLWLLASVPAWSLRADSEQPIHIRAAAAEFDEPNGQAVYGGGVEVRQGTLRVTGERLQVDYQDAKVRRIVATGGPARYQQELEKERGLVKAAASTIVYHAGQDRIDFQGAARLTQAGNAVTGELIRYNIVSEAVDGERTDQGPVRVTLLPTDGG